MQMQGILVYMSSSILLSRHCRDPASAEMSNLRNCYMMMQSSLADLQPATSTTKTAKSVFPSSGKQ